MVRAAWASGWIPYTGFELLSQSARGIRAQRPISVQDFSVASVRNQPRGSTGSAWWRRRWGPAPLALTPPPFPLQVLIMDPGPRESLVQENGKVVVDDGQTNPLLQFPVDFYDLKKEERPLKLRKKLYEFYTAPISKFWGHSVGVAVEKCLSRNTKMS